MTKRPLRLLRLSLHRAARGTFASSDCVFRWLLAIPKVSIGLDGCGSLRPSCDMVLRERTRNAHLRDSAGFFGERVLAPAATPHLRD
jgi:hypothetical protein